MEGTHHGYNDIYDEHQMKVRLISSLHVKSKTSMMEAQLSSKLACLKACNVNSTPSPIHPSPDSSSKLKTFVSSPLLTPNGRTSQGQHLNSKLAFQLTAFIPSTLHRKVQTHQRPASRIKASISSSSRTRHQDGPKMKKWVGSKNCPSP